MTFFYDLNKRLAQLADKHDAKQLAEEAKVSAPKSKLVESIEVAEAGYSAKAGRAGKDLGKPGKNFGKIAKGAAERYGSKEAGERVAGAVLNKLRSKNESTNQDGDIMDYLNDKLKDFDAQQSKTDESALQAYLGKKKYGDAGMKALQKAGRDGASKDKMNQIRNRYDKMDEADMEEGNAFGNAVRKAKADGVQKGETIRVGSKIYPVKEADVVGLAEKKAKPDYIDLDKDGNKKEPMKKAAADKKKSRSAGTAFDKEYMDKLRKEKEAETHSRYDVQDTGYSKRYTRKAVDTDIDKDDAEVSDAPKRRGRPKGADKGPERTTKGAWKHKGDRKVKEDDMSIINRGEYDHEGDMAKKDLKSIAMAAKELHAILGDDQNLPEWVQSKITKALDYINSSNQYMHQEMGDMPVAEIAPPGAKAERMVKGIKKSLSKDGHLSGKDKAIAYATTWKAKNAGKVEEESTETKDQHAEKAGKKVAKDIEYDEGHKGKGDNKAEKAGKKVTKDIEYDNKKDKEEKVDETTVGGSVATAPGGKKSSGGMQFGKGVYEGFNNQVESIITEGMSVNISIDEQGKKSINVNATDQDAEALADLLKMAGLGGAGREGSCPTCSQAPCGCAEMVDENSPDYPTNTETSDDALQYSGGLNGPKSTGQTTVPVVASQLRRQASMEESVELERSLFKTWKNYKG
jgi:flagellar hook-basal body complex protein FliE